MELLQRSDPNQEENNYFKICIECLQNSLRNYINDKQIMLNCE